MLKRLSRWRKAVTGTPSDDLLASRFDRGRRHRDQERAVEKALRESGGSAPTNAKSGKLTAGGDTERMRGVPIQAPGVGSTARGTQPESETVRRDEQSRRRRERFDSSVE